MVTVIEYFVFCLNAPFGTVSKVLLKVRGIGACLARVRLGTTDHRTSWIERSGNSKSLNVI
jgi:hypothetical protein